MDHLALTTALGEVSIPERGLETNACRVPPFLSATGTLKIHVKIIVPKSANEPTE